jgi:hypothetical protein
MSFLYYEYSLLFISSYSRSLGTNDDNSGSVVDDCIGNQREPCCYMVYLFEQMCILRRLRLSLLLATDRTLVGEN